MQYENNQKYHSQFNLNQLSTSTTNINKNNDNIITNNDSTNIIYENVDDIFAKKNKLTDKRPLYHHRSEMNLLLSFDGDTQTITPISSLPLCDTTLLQQQSPLIIDDNIINMETTPPPQLPQPMLLLPSTLPYTTDFNNIEQQLLSTLTNNDFDDRNSHQSLVTKNKNDRKSSLSLSSLSNSNNNNTLMERSLTAFRRQLFAKRLTPTKVDCSLPTVTTITSQSQVGATSSSTMTTLPPPVTSSMTTTTPIMVINIYII